MTNAVIAMLQKQREKINQEQSANFLETLKPLAGRHTYRFMPSWDGSGKLFQEWGQHWIPDGSKKKSVVCHRKTFGDDHDCPVCNAIGAAIRQASSDEEIKELKNMYAGKRYLANVVVLSDKANADKVQILEFGQQLYDQIEGLMLAGYEQDETFDITSATEGYDIYITRSGKGMDTSYTAALALKPSEHKKKYELPQLDQEAKTQANKSPKAALQAIAVATGALPPALEQRATASLSDLREVEEIEDVDFDDVVESSVSLDNNLSDDELDALDDLLD